MAGNRGAGYRGGSSNLVTKSLDLSFNKLSKEEFGAEDSITMDQLVKCASLGSHNQGYIICLLLFKERQNQEKLDKISGTSFHITPTQLVRDSASYHMISNFAALANVDNLS